MRLIDERGRLFGLINVVDLLVLAALICVVGGVAWQLLGHQVKEAVSPESELTMVVVINGCHPELVEEILRQDLAGESMVSGNTYLAASISRVWVDDHVEQQINDQGQLVDTTDPTRKDVYFEVKTQVAKNTPSPKIGSQEARAGKTFILKTQTFECSGVIIYVDIAE